MMVESKPEQWRSPEKRGAAHGCLKCSRRIKWKLCLCCVCWQGDVVNELWPSKPRVVS